jgi:hypothetical protein
MYVDTSNVRMLNISSFIGSLFICVLHHFLIGIKPLFRESSCTCISCAVQFKFSGSILSKVKLFVLKSSLTS